MNDDYLWQLLCNIASHEDSFEVDPQILNLEEVFNNLIGNCEFVHPFLNT